MLLLLERLGLERIIIESIGRMTGWWDKVAFSESYFFAIWNFKHIPLVIIKCTHFEALKLLNHAWAL